MVEDDLYGLNINQSEKGGSMDGFETSIRFLIVLVLFFYLAFGIVPRALGYRNVPNKIEKMVCGETTKSTVVWYYGFDPEKEKGN
ncbi:MAG: hypothetical protein NTU85_00700 [Candidatus Kaiserbacteria bacterium]|nr:hypothetical protein [Candidatus Kaiserbacteria bacterium]